MDKKQENQETSTKAVEQEGSCQETQEDMQSQLDVAPRINLRDRAAQVALNFAGQTISSYDGTYNLLIDCIYDALLEVARSKNMVVEKVYFRPTEQSPFTVCGLCPELPRREMYLGLDIENNCIMHPGAEMRYATWYERANYLGWILDAKIRTETQTEND
jgi:hypothetical protein